MKGSSVDKILVSRRGDRQKPPYSHPSKHSRWRTTSRPRRLTTALTYVYSPAKMPTARFLECFDCVGRCLPRSPSPITSPLPEAAHGFPSGRYERFQEATGRSQADPSLVIMWLSDPRLALWRKRRGGRNITRLEGSSKDSHPKIFVNQLPQFKDTIQLGQRGTGW